MRTAIRPFRRATKTATRLAAGGRATTYSGVATVVRRATVVTKMGRSAATVTASSTITASAGGAITASRKATALLAA